MTKRPKNMNEIMDRDNREWRQMCCPTCQGTGNIDYLVELDGDKKKSKKKKISAESDEDAEKEDDEIEQEVEEDEVVEDSGEEPNDEGKENKENIKVAKRNQTKQQITQKKVSPKKLKKSNSPKGPLISLEQIVVTRDKAGHIKVSLQNLIDSKMIEAGEKCLSVEYMNFSYLANLNNDSTINYSSAQEEVTFKTLSDFAIFCLRKKNPTRKAVNGWTTVRYQGTLLSHVKKRFLETYDNVKVEQLIKAPARKKLEKQKTEKAMPKMAKLVAPAPKKKRKKESSSDDETYNFTGESTSGRRSQRSNFLQSYGEQKASGGDPLEMVVCEAFDSVAKKGSTVCPFSTILTSKAALMMEFHAHLAVTEVIGWLGGTWDEKSGELTVNYAYPCRSLETSDDSVQVEMDPDSEIEVRERISKDGNIIVGWYHSHPQFRPDPSIRDVENQTNYQHLFKTPSNNSPFVGIIVSPYDSKQAAPSTINCFWTRNQNESHASLATPFQMPMHINYVDDINEELMSDMKTTMDYTRMLPGFVDFSSQWKTNNTRLTKLKQAMKSWLNIEEEQEKENLNKLEDLLDELI